MVQRNRNFRISKIFEGRLTDVWIEVSLSEPMILLDEKLKEAHQEKMRMNSLKTINFPRVASITVKKRNSLRLESHKHGISEHRTVNGPVRFGP